jgi:PKD domain-containing protein
VNRRRARLGAIVVANALAAAPAASAALAPPVTIDGPSAAIVSLDGLALAQDGSGAVVYRKLAGGVAHVFAALEDAGVWAAPAQLDATLAAGASASAVAVSNGGRVAVVWISGGILYGEVHPAGASGFSAPQAIAAASGTPALGMGVSGTAYVAFVAPAGTASNIDVARLDRSSTSFALLSGPLNTAPITLPNAGGPTIAVSADATAVVAWAQLQGDGSTHVFVRRASAAGPSPVIDDATVATLGGVTGGSADSPAVGIAYDSSSAWVAFRETFGAVTRVIVTKLLGDELRPPVFADSLGPGAASSAALAPSLAINGNGAGLLASELAPANSLVVAALGTPGGPAGWTPGAVVTSTPDSLPPSPLAALSVSGRGVVVYTPGAGALDAEPFVRGVSSAPLALSSATTGPVVAADGLAAGADDRGDLAVGFVAGSPTALSVLVEPIVRRPGAPRATGTQRWTAKRRPVLRWQASSDSWTPPRYAVYLDGTRVATTAATSYAVPADLGDGRHSWKVVAIDSLGQQAASMTRRLLVDAARPMVALQLAGKRRAGAPVRFTVTATALSGVRRVSLDYGDGHAASGSNATHVYTRAGHYTVVVTVTDGARVSALLRMGLTIS